MATTEVTEKTQAEITQERILETLAQLGGDRVSDESLLQQGRQMILPETMTPQDAISYLVEYVEQQEEETLFDRVFKYRPWDGAFALQEALRTVFGTAGIGKSTWSFFGRKPPRLTTIQTGVSSTTQVPWGKLRVPMFEGTMTLGVQEDPELGQLFHLMIEAPRKFKAHIEGLFTAVEQQLIAGSIYKGMAIDGREQAEFLDLAGVSPDKVIYSDEVGVQLEANVWSLLRHSETMRELELPLKRAILLEGPYGSGKTLAAFLTAQVAVENGWTFVYCRPGKDSLDTVMATARLYQPSVVFFEDVDVVAETGDRDSITRLLDMFDGITAKGTELMVVLTTNHKERIHQGMVRPGRLDAMVHIGALDVNGIRRMIHALVPLEFLGNLDYDEIGEAMGVGTDKGFLPAFVKEAIDRAMRYAIARNEGVPQQLETEDFVQAAVGLESQHELMLAADEGKKPEPLAKALRREVASVVGEAKIVDMDGDPVFAIESEQPDGVAAAK
jgi:hypothetical protein